MTRSLRTSAIDNAANLGTDLLDEEGGQSTVEYMLLISVIVIALVAAAYVFVPVFKAGVQDLGNDVRKILSTGKISKDGTH